MKTNYRVYVWGLLLLSGLTAIVFVIYSLKGMAVSNLEKENSATASSTEMNRRSFVLPATPQLERVESELITILPTGFQPTHITRPPGRFLIAIENRSGISAVNFHLDAEPGNRIFQVSRTWERSDWSEVVNLSPGRYVLTETSHPEWRCVITITQ